MAFSPETLSGLSKERLRRMTDFCNGKRFGTPIDVSIRRGLPTLQTGVEIGRTLCASENSRYLAFKPDVFFVPLDAPGKYNAFAFWQGQFNVVSITAQLLSQLAPFCRAIANHGLENFDSAAFDSARLLSSDPAEVQASMANALLRSALVFIVGHELGHLRAGHRDVVGLQRGGSAGAPEEFAGDGVSFATAPPATGPRANQLELNAHEIDADLQAVSILERYWSSLLPAMTVRPGAVEVPHTWLANPSHALFLKALGVVIALTSLGLTLFDETWRTQSTHPIAAIRMVTTLQVLTYGKAHSGINLPSECADAMALVLSTMAQTILQGEDLEGKSTKLGSILRPLTAENRINVMFAQSGISPTLTNIDAVAENYRDLQTAFRNADSRRESHLLVFKRDLVQWA